MEDSSNPDLDCTSSAAQSPYLEATRRAVEVTVSEERRGHNFVVTADWADIDAYNLKCVVVPSGCAMWEVVCYDKYQPRAEG
jgi:hypothetical protein